MSKTLQSIRGFNDILPSDSGIWQHIESQMQRILSAYGYRQIRLPIVESTELFKRSIGEVTDIVEKEMYSFDDRNGDSLTLRPEGTAGCLRASLQHGLLNEGAQRLWYAGPMFRHERPQRGRYRQFHQLGVEVYGLAGPDIDAEMILLGARLWRALGVEDVELQINSLGDNASRAAYRELLVEYLQDHYARLDEDSQRRLKTNPLRVLDSKNPDLQDLIENAPQLLDHLDEQSRTHFEQLQARLQTAKVPFRINPRLVRGLDYYSKTVFEWVTDRLGAQGTICAGGRYDSLIEQLGGRANHAIGFAIGIERLVELCKELGQAETQDRPHAYLVTLGDAASLAAVSLSEQLRDKLPKLRLINHCGKGNLNNQMKKADRSGATVALILGDEELERGLVGVKFLREKRPQTKLDHEQLTALLGELP